MNILSKIFLTSLLTFSLVAFSACEKPSEKDEQEESDEENENLEEDVQEAEEDENPLSDEYENLQVVDGKLEDPAGRYILESADLESLEVYYSSEFGPSLSNNVYEEGQNFSLNISVYENYGFYEEELESIQEGIEIEAEIYDQIEVITGPTAISTKDGTEGAYSVSRTTDFGDSYLAGAIFFTDDYEYQIDMSVDAPVWEADPEKFTRLIEAFEIK